MKSIWSLAAVVIFATSASAQTLGEFKPKDNSFGMGKLAKAEKKIYISGFSVNYQIYNEKDAFKQGGYVMGGGRKGDASASLSVGLDGLDEATVQNITNKLYEEYIEKLKSGGLRIISADEAAKTDTYQGYERVQGGKISLAEIPGTLAVTPSGFEYFIKGTNAKGKEKKGGFLGNEAMLYPKLSRDLGDAIIGDVNMTVLFVRDQNAFQGSGVKLKIKTELRLVDQESIMMASDAKIKFKGANTVTPVSSSVAFYHGKMGMGATTTYNGTMGKPLLINGVIEDTKVTAAARGSVDMVGTQTMYYTYFNVKDGHSENTKVIPVDKAKYEKGVYEAAHKFLDYHTTEFLKSL